jgi:hypothetical protein
MVLTNTEEMKSSQKHSKKQDNPDINTEQDNLDIRCPQPDILPVINSQDVDTLASLSS